MLEEEAPADSTSLRSHVMETTIMSGFAGTRLMRLSQLQTVEKLVSSPETELNISVLKFDRRITSTRSLRTLIAKVSPQHHQFITPPS
jgi:hypothetical protein